MFEIGRSRFYKKIRKLLKLSKTRVDAIINKRNAVHKYLQNDIAELLSNGLDVNAYGRAEGLLVELNISSCYDFIEQCVGCILAKLAAMESQRECPNECREAAQSLMHAAARFADLPELRELRTVFTERYGNSLEPFLNKEFAEMLRSGPPTKEKKLQFLQDIAQEYSILFDPVSLERKIFKPAPPVQEKSRRGSSNDTGDDGYNCHRRKDDALLEREGHNRGDKMSNMWEKPKHRSSYDAEDDGSNQHKTKDDALPERDGHNRGNNISNLRGHDVPKRNEKDLRYRGKKGVPDDRYNIPSSSEDEVLANNRRNSTSQDSEQSSSSSVGSFSEEEVHSRKPFDYGSIPPPYVKQHNVNESNGFVNAEQNDQSQPTSARTSTLKPPPGCEVVSNGSEENARKGEKARQCMQSLRKKNDEDQIDEEEKKLERLLMHYSKKNHHPGHESDDTGRATRYSTKRSDNYGKSPKDRHAKGNANPSPGFGSYDTVGAGRHRRTKSELPHQPARATSIPSEPAAGYEGTRGHNRAKSMQAEMVGGLGHVHPKLPDYDDLAAQLAALRGK